MTDIKTNSGGFIIDDNGKIQMTYYAPGQIPLVGKDGRKCETCYHWEKRKTDPGWKTAAECPCFECAGYGYSVFEDLEYWEPIQEVSNDQK